MDLFAAIPGYRAAVEAERLHRDLAFADVAASVAGIPVRPLTWRLFTRLAVSGSPFIVGGPVTPIDVAAALWLLSPHYHPRRSLRRWWFLRQIRRRPYLELITALDEYFQTALQDAPGGGGTEERVSYYSAVAAQVDLFAHAYGWTVNEILDVPLEQLWQLLRCLQARNGETVFWNPSDKVRGAYLAQVNEGRN